VGWVAGDPNVFPPLPSCAAAQPPHTKATSMRLTTCQFISPTCPRSKWALRGGDIPSPSYVRPLETAADYAWTAAICVFHVLLADDHSPTTQI
jgi:hypothetical protein